MRARPSLVRATLVATALWVASPPPAVASVELLLSGAETVYDRVADAIQAQIQRLDDEFDHTLIRRRLDATAQGDDVSVRVAIGLAACKAAVRARARPAVLCALVPKADFMALAHDTPKAPTVSAIYLDQPIARQFSLARALVPNASQAGLLAGPRLQQSRGAIISAARAAGFSLNLLTAQDERTAAAAIQPLVTDSELILAVYDPTVLTPTSAKWLLHLAYKRQRPVIGFSRAYVDAGAIAAVFSTPEQIGAQAARAIAPFLRRQGSGLPPPSYPSDFAVAVNRPVAAALGLAPPSDEQLMREVAAQLKAAL